LAAQPLAADTMAADDLAISLWLMAAALLLILSPQDPSRRGQERVGRRFARADVAICRLDGAAAMLRDPGSVHRKIGEIASGAGFSDISHFNRSFRRRFGDTPARACRPASGIIPDRLAVLPRKRTAHRNAPSSISAEIRRRYGQACRRPS
jgi:AraC-like DNA-binding protein